MDFRRWITRFVALLLCVPLLVGLLACERKDTGPKTWIDEPIDGATVARGEPVRVISHAFARQGVHEVELSINGDPWERVPIDPPESPFGKAMHKWVPKEDGRYVLQVIAFDTQGRPSSKSAEITVRVPLEW